MPRPDWDTYFMSQCDLIAQRGTCDRKRVGSVLTKDNRIISTGYNSSLPGQPHCDDPEIFYQCVRCGKKSIVSSYNASLGKTVCSDSLCRGETVKKQGGHDMKDHHCVTTVHSEINTIAQAARMGISTEGSVLYCNVRPCWQCFKAIVSAGVKEIVYKDEYRSDDEGRIETAARGLPGFIIRKYSEY